MFPNNGNNLSPHQVQHNLLLQQQQQQQQLQQLQFQLQLQQQQQQPQHHHLQQPQQQQHQPQLQSQQPPQSPHHAINTQTLAGAAAFFPNLEQPTVPSYQAPSTSSSTLPPSEFQVVWQGHWYEGGADAMEVDRDRMQNRELKLSASSLLQLTELIHQHFPTSPEQPISLTTDDQVPLTEGEFEKLRRKRNPVVLVFEPRPGDKNSESIRWQWSTSFQHVPHPSIVTYSQELIAEEGRGANNVLAYALAEFIDNSISAIRKFAKQAQRVVPRDYGTIKVLILEHIKAKTYSIVIEDDGCGMNGETLQAFSRMGDAPTHRGEVRENVDADADNNFLNINISQWGIGAKSAGFFIGETIVVSSRPEGLKQVIECSMSQKKMFEEHQKTGNAFNDEMSRRAVAKVEDYPPLKQGHLIHPYLRELIREELDEKHKSHFTRVVVTGIEERHIPKLSQPDGVLEIVKELANIYNRFLFGPLGSNCPDQNASKIWMSPNIMVQHILELDQTNSGGRMFRTKHQWKLKEMKENETYQFQQMRQGPIFRFEMLVKVNFPTTHSMESLRGRDNVAKLRGEIYYLPRSVDGETHLGLKKTGNEEEDPRSNQLVHLRTKPRGAGSRAAAALAPTPAAVAATRLNAQGLPTMVDSVDADGNIISSDEGALDIFDIYWHGRLIPLSHVSKLNFMKVTPDNKDCLRRMKGYLFLAFPFLTSRNKLTVQERNLTDYLNGKDRIVSIETLDDNGYPFQHQLSSNRVEARWKNCIAEWKSLDANYTWDEKFKLVDASLKEGKELYSQVSIHGAANADFKVLTAGKIYKVWNKNQKNPSKPQWIEAMWFEKEVVPFAAAVVVASEFGGSGKIWGTIMPREGSNSGILVKSLRMVEKDTPLAEQKKEYEQHKAVVMAGEPHHIEVWMEPHHRLKDGDEFHKTSDWCFPGTAIAAFGHMHPTDRVFKALSGERVNLNVNHYAKEFQGEEVATKGGRLKKGGVFVKPPQRTTGSSSTATTAQPKKKAKTSTTTSRDVDDSSGHDSEDVEYTAPPSNKQSRTARPKQIRRAGAGNNVNQMHDDSDEEEEKKNDDTSDEDEPMLIIPQQPVDPDATNLFNDVAPTMSRDVAEGVSRGAEVKISNNRNEADVAAAAAADAAAASSAVSGKKRKSTTAEASAFLGKNGFIPFDFMHHTLCGRFQFTFSLEDWTIDKRFISRQHVAPVRCQVFLTPALPSSITLAQVRGADPVLDLPLNSHDYSSTIGFHLEDKYKNVWNFPNLRGNMDLCGIQVCSITTSVAELIAQCEPALGWDPDKKHWYLRKLLLTLPEDSVSPLNFKDARDRIDVTVTLKFDRNANYKFDPPPSQEALHKLRNMAVSFKVKLGPGSATDFMFENTDALLKLGSWNAISLENYSYLEGLSMHFADAWRHRTVGSPDMQISVHAALLFLPQTSFTSDHDVLTDSGWKPIRSIREGDNVWALQDPDTKNLKQQWTTVVSVKQSPAPATLYRTAESNHWGLLVANAHVLDGTASIEEPRGAHQHVYSLTTTARNFYVRRHAEIGAEQHWSGIFTGESDFREFHFPLPSLPTPKLYDLDRFGAVQFERVLLALPPELFSTHCVEVDAGHPVVEFNVLVQLRFKDEPDKPHSIRTMRVTVKPRWGPIKLGLFPDNSHLQNIHKHFDLDNIPTLKLSGIANEEIHNLHIAFFQESGFILPVKTFIQGIQPRHKQVHLFFDTLEGASTHITLADLNEDGKIESGLNLPSIISSSAAQNENSMEESVSKTSVSDFLMEVIDAKEPVEETEIEEKETEDVEMVDATAATSSTPTLRRSKRKLAEAKPKLSDVLPFAKLSTAFQITVSPAPPVRWALSTSFPRGFKTGLVWSSYVRMFLVDQFGNRTAVPQLAEGQEIKIEIQVHSAPPEKETNLPAAAITATAMDIEGAPVSTQPSSASSGPGAAAVVPSSSTLVDPTSLKSWHPSRAKRTDNTLADYFSAPPAFLVVKAGSYWLVVSDKFSLFKPSHSVAVQLQAGAPHRIRAFTSDKCTDADEVGYPTSDLTLASKSNPIYCFSKGKIDRLWVKFFDRGGNETICNQTVELQLVLPKDANTSASAASASAAPQIEGGATTTAAPPAESSQPGASVRVKPEPADVDMQDGSRKEGESVQDDATVSGIYAYPLFQTRPAHQSIFQRTDASGHAIPMSRNSLVPVKDEYVPLTNLTGALKNSAAHAAAPATAFVLLEEFTLHLNAKHFRGSSLLIQAREVNKAAANNPTNKSKKPLKAIKNDIVIALEVKPFVQGVTGVRVASVFDGLRVQQLLQAKPTELSLRAELTATPSIFRFKSKARNAADAETENDGDSILSSAVAAAVPAGTPFPLIQVDLVINGVVGGGLSTTSSQQSHEAPFSPRVKPEPTEVIVPCSATSSSQSGSQESSYLLPFLSEGLSIEVFVLPRGLNDPSERKAVNNLYQRARYDHARGKFVFEPIRTEVLQQLEGANAVSQDAVARTEDYVFDCTGDWLFLVRWLEPREYISNVLLPTECEHVAHGVQKVANGQPTTMSLAISRGEQNAASGTEIVVSNVDVNPAAASHQITGPRASRLIAREVSIKLFDHFNNLVPLDTLSAESVNVFKQMRWKVTAENEKPLPPPPTPVARPSASPGKPSRAEIIVIDSDDEEAQDVVPAPVPPPAAVIEPLPSTAASARVIPQITMSAGEFDLANSALVFRDVCVQPQSAGESGKYSLHFILPRPYDEELSASLDFYFSNDVLAQEKLMEQLQRKRAAVSKVEKIHAAKMQEIVSTQEKLTALERSNSALRQRMDISTRTIGAVVAKLERLSIKVPSYVASSVEALHRFVQEQNVALRNVQSSQNVHVMQAKVEAFPATVSLLPPTLTKAGGYHGRVVELASISDLKLCALISWHTQHMLSTFVTSDRSCVADRDLRTWCRNNRIGQVSDLAGQNPNPFNANQLPHEFVRHNPNVPPYVPRGNPRYLVNCLDFYTSVPYERHLYQSLFQNLFGKVLIMDSMAEAVDYRSYLVQQKHICPSILVLKELKLLPSNNVERFDDRAYARGLNSLANHFEVRPRSAIQGSSAMLLHEQLEQITQLLTLLPQVEQEQQKTNHEIASLDFQTQFQQLSVKMMQLKAERMQLENQLKSLGVDPRAQRLVSGNQSHDGGAASSSSSAAGSAAAAAASSAARPSPASSSSLVAQSSQNELDRRRARNAAMLEEQRDREKQRNRR